jgi:hypothetical protein
VEADRNFVSDRGTSGRRHLLVDGTDIKAELFNPAI